MLSVRNLTKIYKLSKKKGSKTVVALDNVSVDFPDKGMVFLLGKSGSGKSTLLNSIGGLDTFDKGEIIIKGKSSKDFKQSDFDSYRNTFIGFIFQEYNILEEFTVGKNLSLALELQGKKADKKAVETLLEQVDLNGFYKRKPNQLSGGQKQRIAIARALIKDPEIIMADEPTGALDSNTGRQVMETLQKLSKTKLVIVVSHDREFAFKYGDRVVELKDGKIISDETKKEVEAEKSASGVSFIDNKIIHVRKGQKLTKEDLTRINKMIVDNAENSDTIISFDEKSNEEVKKSAFITDEGNREVFKSTKEEDILRETHDPKKFKLIRSKLKFKDSFKMGASALKHKPIRLIFTILLACVAFTMFGVVDTMASFDKATSVCESISTLNLSNFSVAKFGKSYGYIDSAGVIAETEFNKVKEQNPDYIFLKVLGTGSRFYLNKFSQTGSGMNDYDSLDRNSISGVTYGDEATLAKLKINLIEGRMPSADNEICISEHVFNILKNSTTLTSFEELKNAGDAFNIGTNRNTESFSVVGIIKDDTNLSKYEKLEPRNYESREIIDTIVNYSSANLCVITENKFNDYYEDMTFFNFNNLCYYIRYDDDGGYSSWSVGTSEVRTPNMLTNIQENVSYVKSGVDVNALASNQILVSSSYINNLSMSESEFKQKIEEGIQFELSLTGSSSNIIKLDIVGIVDYGFVVSESFIENNCKGYSAIFNDVKGDGRDKALVNSYIKMGDENNEFIVQIETTPQFNTFSGMIESMKKPFLYVGIGLAVFAGLMLMNFIATSISYKKREIGVLRAIGARGKDVFSIFFSESFIICIINFLISVGATIGACIAINNSLLSKLGLSITLLSFGIRQILLLFGVSLLVAFVSSFIPVYKIAKKNPIDSINNR